MPKHCTDKYTALFAEDVTFRCGKSFSFFCWMTRFSFAVRGLPFFSHTALIAVRTRPNCQTIFLTDSLLLLQLGVDVALQLLLTLQLLTQIPMLRSQTKHCHTAEQNKQSGIHRGWRKQKHPICEHKIKTSDSPVVCRFLSLDLFLQVIPLFHQTLNVLTTEFQLFSGEKKHKTTETSSSVDTEKHPGSKSVRRNIFRAVLVQYVQNIRLRIRISLRPLQQKESNFVS